MRQIDLSYFCLMRHNETVSVVGLGAHAEYGRPAGRPYHGNFRAPSPPYISPCENCCAI